MYYIGNITLSKKEWVEFGFYDTLYSAASEKLLNQAPLETSPALGSAIQNILL